MIEIIPNWHPLFVHFTVALLSMAVGFFLLAWMVGNRPIREQWLIVAYWNLWVGTGLTVITAIAGWFVLRNDVVAKKSLTCVLRTSCTMLARQPSGLHELSKYKLSN